MVDSLKILIKPPVANTIIVIKSLESDDFSEMKNLSISVNNQTELRDKKLI